MKRRKSEIELVSSPALVVRADTSVRESVRQMKDAQVGSVLVVSDDGHDSLIGIFTERDLVQKIDIVHEGGHWDKPVRTVMTQPIRTIEVSEIATAGDLMLATRSRHLPVVRVRPEGGKELLGVISMRDLFQAEIRRRRDRESNEIFGLPTGDRLEGRIEVVEERDLLASLLKAAFLRQGGVQVTTSTPGAALSAENWLENVGDASALVVDIDGFSPPEWSELLREINRSKDYPQAFVVFDRGRYGPEERRILLSLSKSRQFSAFAKPVNVPAMIFQLAPLMAK